MPHIDLARWCNAVLVAPASAHLLATLTHGGGSECVTC
jgi:phosphopantothenoylcysteine synthetase/decarboxylase